MSDGKALVPYQQDNSHFSTERGMKMLNQVQVYCA
jgi:hypothetical protein